MLTGFSEVFDSAKNILRLCSGNVALLNRVFVATLITGVGKCDKLIQFLGLPPTLLIC